MIEYNYTIKRDEGDGIKTYVPAKIPTKLPNLVYIEGPNSLGKSTLLNMVALAMHGLNKKNMNISLIQKMESLVNTDYQEVSFDFRINDQNGNLEIAAEKHGSNKQIVVYEIKDGKKSPMSPEKMEREYNLIYDIPYNPVARLNQLTTAIKYNQLHLGNRVSLFRAYLQKVIGEVKTAKDPEQISKLEKEVDQLRKEYGETLIFNKKRSAFLKDLMQYTYAKCFLDSATNVSTLEYKISELKKQQKDEAKKQKKADKEQLELIRALTNIEDRLTDNFNLATKYLRGFITKEADLLPFWENINIAKSVRELEFNKNLPKVINKFRGELSSLLSQDRLVNTYEQTEIWKKIVSVLEKHKTKNFVIPGADKTINQFIKILKQETQKQEETTKYGKDIQFLLGTLDDIQTDLKDLEDYYFPRMKQFKDISWSDDNDNTEVDTIKKLEQDLKHTEQKKSLYLGQCAANGINVSTKNEVSLKLNELKMNEGIASLGGHSEEQLIEKIRSVEKEVESHSKKAEQKKTLIDFKTNEIEQLKNREPHKYQDKYDELNNLLRVSQLLEQKLRKQFDDYITKIIANKFGELKSEDQKKYLNEVSKYLGRRIGSIRHVDKDYEIKEVDLAKGAILTKEEKIIRLMDMGTGQSQSAYLIGQLNTSDNRKIIALFDEVAMMDKDSLQPIFKKMRELYNSGRLLLGIVVQKGQEIKVEEIEG